MRKNILLSLLYIVIIGVLTTGIVYLFNKDALESANKPKKSLTSESYTEEARDSVQVGDVVEITGTPNLLQQVSQESLDSSTSDPNDRKIDFYYTGLKEYGSDFIVRISPGKLKAESQQFSGKVIGITHTEFDNRIKNSLNKAIDFKESINSESAAELDEASQKQIAEQSTSSFTNSTLLILDGEVTDPSQIQLNILFWSAIFTLFLTTLFRKKVFGLK
jgi:hypothetical protein